MKKILTNWRYYVLIALMLAAMALLGADADDSLPFWEWLYIVASTKILSFAIFYVIYRLAKRWEAQDLIPEITDIPDKY